MTLDWQSLRARLARSAFRSRFRLDAKDAAYLREKGMETILRHAEDFIAQRLAPAHPRHDGRQTPWKGHPVFVAQHATGCCCRNCLRKWHNIPEGRPLSAEEQAYVRSVLACWLTEQECAAGFQRDLPERPIEKSKDRTCSPLPEIKETRISPPQLTSPE